jgi:ABC-type sugar transport system, periplasmic component
MRFQKKLFLLLCVSLMLISVIGVNAFAAKKLVVGIACREITNDYNRGVIAGAKKVVEAAGGEVIVTDAQTDIRKHIDNVSNLITRGVSGIIVQLGDSEQFVSVFQKANKAKIPVVTTTFGSTTPGALCDVNPSDAEMTKILTKQLLSDIHEKGNVFIISVPGAPILETRVKTMQQILSGYKDIKVADPLPTQHSVPYTLNVMQNLLTAHPNPGDITAVFVTYDQIASGAVQAIKNAGRSKDIKVYAIDGDAIGYQMLFDKEGPFYASISQNSADTGEAAAQMIMKALKGQQKSIPSTVYPKVSLVSKTDFPAAIKVAKEKWGADAMKVLGVNETELLKK